MFPLLAPRDGISFVASSFFITCARPRNQKYHTQGRITHLRTPSEHPFFGVMRRTFNCYCIF
jgi:hypothetical protein